MFDDMVLIPEGEFQMGNSSGEGNANECPVHAVYLDAFYMDRHEVTNVQYKRFTEATGHEAPKYWGDERFNQPNQPVVGVDWHDAAAYAKWAGKRLPTEAEWEKAARGTDGRIWPWGNEWDVKKCNNYTTGPKKTTPVGNYPQGASPYGLMDMVGNVWEWCTDWYDSNYYSRSDGRNPKGADTGAYRVLRGGSWFNNDSRLRVASRLRSSPTNAFFHVGFRCARDITS